MPPTQTPSDPANDPLAPKACEIFDKKRKLGIGESRKIVGSGMYGERRYFIIEVRYGEQLRATWRVFTDTWEMEPISIK